MVMTTADDDGHDRGHELVTVVTRGHDRVTAVMTRVVSG